MSPPRAVLDSDVIYSRVLHELMGRVAAGARLLDLIWSDELLAEARNSLIEHKGVPEAGAEQWVDFMRASFPDNKVDITQLSSGIDLSSFTRDFDDEPVCALALAGDADLLFTFDRGYLAPPLAAHSVTVTRPGGFLAHAAHDEPDLIRAELEKQARAWKGGRPVPELLEALERANVPDFVAAARQLW